MSGIRGIGIGIGGLDGLPTQVGPSASPAAKGPSSFADAGGEAAEDAEIGEGHGGYRAMSRARCAIVLRVSTAVALAS